MQTRPMVLRKALVTPDGAVVVPIGTGGKARPHAEPGRMIFRTRVDGAPRAFAVPEDALEPAPEAKRLKRRDDLVLPAPEPPTVETLLRESASEWRLSPPPDRMAWPVALAGGLIVAVALGAAFLGVV